ncbi:hypothetical protein GCM10009864_15620 [Streptomyces lunalinharesii]|uniref:Uncharacterized protein n=1 Tax=Streptomyces lunalinharesii TaxID=333384 RepID=A0ABN3RH61_9ACTN
MAWVPIEPVEPRITISRGLAGSPVAGSKRRCGWARVSVMWSIVAARRGAPATEGARTSYGRPAGRPYEVAAPYW